MFGQWSSGISAAKPGAEWVTHQSKRSSYSRKLAPTPTKIRRAQPSKGERATEARLFKLYGPA